MAYNTEIHETSVSPHRSEQLPSPAQLTEEAKMMLGPNKSLTKAEHEKAECIYQQMDAIWQSVIDSNEGYITERVIEDFLESSQYPVMCKLENSLRRIYEKQPFPGLNQAQYQWIKETNALLDALNDEMRCRLEANSRTARHGQCNCNWKVISSAQMTILRSTNNYSH